MTRALAIGIDLGGTQVRAALVDGAGVVLRRAAALTDVEGGPERVVGQIGGLVAEVAADFSDRIAGIGVSAPGPLDSDAGTVLHIPTLPRWDDFPLRGRLAAELALPVVLENDGIAAAYGEWRHGAGIGLEHLVYVTVSTGIGGGVVVDGRLMRGRRGMAAHVGHIHMMPAGPRCSCGAVGCFEALAAGTALGKAGRATAERHPSSLLASLAPLDTLGANHVVVAARRGDPLALALIDQEATYLGIGFVSLIHLYSPERIIMGGGVSAAFDLMERRIHAVIRERAMAAFRDVSVVPAGLGINSGLVGAAALALGRYGGTEAEAPWEAPDTPPTN